MINQTELNKLYSPKQQEVLKFYCKHRDFFFLINHGSVRTGKTIIDNDLFIADVLRVKNYAESKGIIAPQYILAGASIGNIQKNVFSELTQRYGLKLKLDKYNRFNLFGVQVCCTGHDDSGQLPAITGMTSFGAYINEAAFAKKEVFLQIIKRCSADIGFNAHIIADTNPQAPVHYLKKDFIDKADGRRIKAFHWQLDDNTFLPESYKQNIIATTPTGVFFDRDILGQWATAEGIVYMDFDEKIHVIDALPSSDQIIRYYAGVDWGYEHPGSIVLFAQCRGGYDVIVKEITSQHKLIDWWVDEAKKIVSEYGFGIPFYCDSAEPDKIKALQNENIWAVMANKTISSGIEYVAKRVKTRKLFIYRGAAREILNELYAYVWDEKTGLPVKVNDHVMDAVRYGAYTDSLRVKREGG